MAQLTSGIRANHASQQSAKPKEHHHSTYLPNGKLKAIRHPLAHEGKRSSAPQVKEQVGEEAASCLTASHQRNITAKD
ncbi:hypothetical protein D3C85_1752140 [compost metagenome]